MKVACYTLLALSLIWPVLIYSTENRTITFSAVFLVLIGGFAFKRLDRRFDRLDSLSQSKIQKEIEGDRILKIGSFFGISYWVLAILAAIAYMMDFHDMGFSFFMACAIGFLFSVGAGHLRQVDLLNIWIREYTKAYQDGSDNADKPRV